MKRGTGISFFCSFLLLVLGGILANVPALAMQDGTLLWHTYQGGTGFVDNNHDEANDMALDDAGNIYIVGTSVSAWDTSLVPTNPHNPLEPMTTGFHTLNQDIVVAKFNSVGTLVWHTFLGASVHWWPGYGGFWAGSDEGLGIAVDTAADAVYITGWSSYPWGNPISPFVGLNPEGVPWQPGPTDAFVARLSSINGALVWNTFIGAGNGDKGQDVAVNSTGNVYVVGQSWSSWGSPVRAHYGGYGGDAFVAQFDSAGALSWNTFLGGTNYDDANGIGFGPTGDIFVAGMTNTYWAGPTWPATTTDQLKDPAADFCPSAPEFCGNPEAYVARLCNSTDSCAPEGTGELMWYGFYGSALGERGDGIALDDTGYLYLVGSSEAGWGGPATIDAHVGGWDVFAAKIDATTGTLAWNTFLGGSMSDGADGAAAITADPAGNVFVTGSDYGPDYTGSHKTELFAARLNTDGYRQWYVRPFHLPDSTGHVTASNSANAILLLPEDNPIMAGWGMDQWGPSGDPAPTPIDDHTNPVWSRDVLITTLYAGTDTDSDGWVDDLDICPDAADPLQLDTDNDGFGDECDNCPAVANPDQADNDADGIGDVCEPDTDADGVIDDDDNCPMTSNPDQTDLDDDRLGDACDEDDDGDAVEDAVDNCPDVLNPDQQDTDFDGQGDACDTDDDNDGFGDGEDNCPANWNPTQVDADGDGIGDACDDDADGDGVPDSTDNCPDAYNPDQADADGDGIGDACDQGSGDDEDGDGVDDEFDLCEGTPNGTQVDPTSGCSIEQRCPCSTDFFGMQWKNHGSYVSCVAHASEDILHAGLITEAEKDVLVSLAARSECGRKVKAK